MKTTWMLDGTINLTAIGNDNNWHLGTMIEKLTAAGLNRADAGAFANFMCNEYAAVSDSRSEDWVTEEQYDRLSIA